jgi:hypothetical protein
MSETNVKIYAVSVLAMSQLHELAPRGGSYIEHRPALVPASSIDEAAEAAKEFAFQVWPVGDNWYGHQAAIQPVTKEFFDIALRARDAGAIDLMTDEPPDTFRFDT